MERLKCFVAIQFLVPCLLLFNSHDIFRDAVTKRGKAPMGKSPSLLQIDGGRYRVRTSDPCRVKDACAAGETQAQLQSATNWPPADELPSPTD